MKTTTGQKKTLKSPVKKKSTVKSVAKKTVKPVVKTAIKTTKISQPKKKFHVWDLSIYIYWFIILFFIGATTYILGARHMFNQQNTVEFVAEERLMQNIDYILAGTDKMKAGDMKGAAQDFTVALKTENPSPDVFVLRGQAYFNLGEYNMAKADFDTALALDTLNAVGFYSRALLFMKTENYAEALADINNTLAANAVNPSELLSMRDVYAKRGQLNLWLKNWAGAVADYTNSLARQSGNITANVYAERGEAYTALGEYVLAEQDYTSAIRIISEQIAGKTSQGDKEDLSRQAMSYFQKSAALNIQQNDMVQARDNLESAYIIATALNDKEMIQTLSLLILELY